MVTKMTIPNREYWARRAEQRMAAVERGTDPYLRNISSLYARAAAQIKTDIEAILQAYQRNGSLTRNEALQLLKDPLSPAELDVIRARLAAVEDLEERLRLSAKLNAPAYKARIDRLEGLRLATEAELSQLAPNQIAVTDQALMAAAKDSYARTVFNLQKGTRLAYQFARVTESQIEAVLKQRWSGDHYSDRIWRNTQDLANRLPDIIQQNMVTGRSWRRCIDEVDDLVQRGGVFSAERILRTETAFVANEMDAQAYEDADIEQYEFVATLDNRTSEVCQEHDGKRYDLEDREPGENYPPLHPFCRSTTIEVVDDDILAGLERRSKDPQTGQTRTVPSTMKYADWKAIYVDQSLTTDDWIKQRSSADVKGAVEEIQQNDIIKKTKLIVESFPNYFTSKSGKKQTEVFVNYVNTLPDGDDDMLRLYNSLGKMENIGTIGANAKVSYTATGHAVNVAYRSSTKDLTHLTVKIPKIDEDNRIGAVQTTAHELGHLMDLFGRQTTKYSSWASEVSGPVFQVRTTTVSPKIKALFDGFNARVAEIDSRIAKKYKDLHETLDIEYVEAKKSPYKNYSMFKEYVKKRKQLLNLRMQEADDESRNALNGINNLQDIYDALSHGLFRDTGVVRYGHGSKYYSSEASRAHEVWANYAALSITRPDLIRILAEDQPQIVKAMEGVKKLLLEKVGG